MDSNVFSVLSPFNAFEVNSILHHFPEGAVKKGEKQRLFKAQDNINNNNTTDNVTNDTRN